ncbi:MAG: acyl-CoA dehydrogenase family protein [Desulfobacterales bacterium]|nr:acyl-CoA dehydrogenase family protein [Desulfobacterales bacterium]
MVKDQITKFAETKIKPIAADLDHTHRHPEEICRAAGRDGHHGRRRSRRSTAGPAWTS